MRPSDPPTAVNVADNRSAWKKYAQEVEKHNVAPVLGLAIDPLNDNVEFLIALNAANGLWDRPAGKLSDEEYARSFLIEHSPLFKSYPEVFTDCLVLKHILHSLVGTHLIFDLRAVGSNVEDVGFTVHLDRQRHIVMVCAAYDPQRTYDVSQIELAAVPNDELTRIMSENKPRGALGIERVWLADPDHTDRYTAAWRFKFLDQTNTTQYCLIDQGQHKTEYSVDPAAAPTGYGIGRVYPPAWIARRSAATPKWVVLRDLTSDRELVGRYVVVQDEINPMSPTWSEFEDYAFPDIDHAGFRIDLSPPPGKFDFAEDTSWSDRVMAYYHTDLVQRYFREIGLLALDDYPALNPIKVRLSQEAETRFINSEQCLRLTQIDQAKRREQRRPLTQAREPRVIYHEFTHAVTDSLARLQRSDWKNEKHRRHHQMLQAAAMDEGFADYFACSLAARDGAPDPTTFGLLTLKRGRITRQPKRNLALLSEDNRWLSPILHPDKSVGTESAEVIKYEWGKRWGKFLWQIRDHKEIGAETADRLIATSLFFLTRWSTIVVGILALMLTDQLLFAGVHRPVIRKIAAEGGIDLDEYSLKRYVENLTVHTKA